MTAHPLPRARGRVVVAMIAAILCAAATPGDIGGCGQSPDDQDPRVFFSTLEYSDCAACMKCGFTTATCGAACNPAPGDVPINFAEGCAPLVHDAEVCLRRLQSASCSESARYLGDDDAGHPIPLASRARPTECDFCPAR